MSLYAGIEAGGTKFVCAIGNGQGEIYERINLATDTPEKTIPQLLDFLHTMHKQETLAAIGIGSFGPIDAHLDSPTYGFITSTPKTDWINVDIVSPFKQAFNIPVGFATDVATAALGEYRWGAGQHLQNVLYMTVGTGIGAANVVNGRVLSGLGHQEMGHMLIPHDRVRDPFAGVCPYHHDCLEGLACGGAIKQRWQVASALDLPADHEAWQLQADYLGTALANCILALTPERIILGGGVMRQMHLFPKIRTSVLQKLNGYISETALLNHIDHFIVPPGLSDRAGVAGAIALAQQTLQQESA